MERGICLLVGYCFGLLQTGYIYGRMQRIDIRDHGSGNSGTTNALRVMGPKAGLVVFLGDLLKTLIPCLFVRFVLNDRADMGYLLILYAGLGVILGHNYPFYLNFKGGKGIAATVGLMAATDLTMTLLCIAVFLGIFLITRYVSLGSLIMAVIFFIWLTVCSRAGDYGLAQGLLLEFHIITAMISGLAFWRHRANIIRLMNGTENQISLGSKNKMR